MKTAVKFLGVVALCVAMAACGSPGNHVRIEGAVEGYSPDERQPAIAYYDHDKIDTLTVANDGRFTYTTDVEDRTEVLFIGLIPQMISVVVQPGDKMSFKADNGDPTRPAIAFSGDNAELNDFINSMRVELDVQDLRGEWSQERVASTSFKDYRDHFDQVFERLQPLVDRIPNADERARQQAELDMMRHSFYFRHLWANSMWGDKPADSDSDFVAYAQSIDLNDRRMLEPNGGDRIRYAVDNRLRWELLRNPKYDRGNIFINKLAAIEDLVTDPEIADLMASGTIEAFFRSAEDTLVTETYELYRKIATNPEDIERFEAMYLESSNLGQGKPAPDISLEDISGGKLMLSDLRGKNLYIDIWATWCAPCVKEIPFIEKLHEKYADNPNIAFVSISVDEDEQAWKTAMTNDKPQWPNYLAVDGFKGAIGTRYNIMSIPRFMMIDKQGNIVSINAPRPSNPDIEEFLAPYL